MGLGRSCEPGFDFLLALYDAAATAMGGKPHAPVVEQALLNARARLSDRLAAWGVPGIGEVTARDATAHRDDLVAHMVLDQDPVLATRMRAADPEVASAAAAEYSAILADSDDPRHVRAVRAVAAQGAFTGLWNAAVPVPMKTRLDSRDALAAAVREGATTTAPATADAMPQASPQLQGELAADPAQAARYGNAIGPDGTLRPRLGDPFADGRITAEEQQWLRAYHAITGRHYREGDLATMQDRQRLTKELATAGSAEHRTLLQQAFDYHHLGTESQRRLLDEWEAIAFDDPGHPVTVAGRRVTPTELAGMDAEHRRALADAWLQAGGRAGHVQELRDLRAAYEASHAEYAQVRAWARAKRAEWGDGLALYRQQLSRENPNARRYFEQQSALIRQHLGAGATPSALTAALDDVTLTMAAFEAVHGIRRSLYDPTPLPTSDPARAVADPTGPNAGGPGPAWGSGQSHGARVTEAIAATEAALGAVNAHLSQTYGAPVDYTTLPPPVRHAVDVQLPPDALPSDAWIYFDYREFADHQTRVGGDPSLAAHVAATDHGREWRTRTYSSMPGGWGLVTGTMPGSPPSGAFPEGDAGPPFRPADPTGFPR